MKIFEWYVRQHLFTHSFILSMVILLVKHKKASRYRVISAIRMFMSREKLSSVSSDTSKQKDIKISNK